MNIDTWLLDPEALDAHIALPTCPHCFDEILVEGECPDCDEFDCDHCGEAFPQDELSPCAVEPDFLFCSDCADKLRDC